MSFRVLVGVVALASWVRASHATPSSQPASAPSSGPASQPVVALNPAVDSGETVVRGKRVALEAPPNVYDQLVSDLRYEPLVDLQTRNLGEAQGDVSVRGGIFENTGFALGAATLFDPQTGHYFAEIPLSPEMTSRPAVLLGVDNAISGFNSSVATLSYWLKRIRDQTVVNLGAGTAAHHHQQLYLGRRFQLGSSGEVIAADVGVAHSAGDGTQPDGDHRFYRFSGRLQYITGGGQSDVLVGYQRKFFGWRYLYALRALHEAAGSSGAETETLHSLLVLANHRRDYAAGYLEGTVYYRRNTDDYELDRRQPGLFNPFRHETRVGALGLQGRHDLRLFALRYGAQATFDSIESTALTFGDYNSRAYLKGTLVLEREFEHGRVHWGARAGVSVDWSSRDDAAAAPLGELWIGLGPGGSRLRVYAQYAEATQLPGYTALKSNPAGGLFRGNADLRRERTRNLELGARLRVGALRVSGALFYRRDDDLVDWTVVSSLQRTAENIDLQTLGGELVASWRYRRAIELTVAQTLLHKLGGDELRRQGDAPASFYAFNYANYRLTLAATIRPWAWISLRADSELRVQADNALREGPRTALLSTAALSVHPTRSLTIAIAVDNLFDSSYQEVPGVPASLRQLLATLQWRSR